jgi:hypothetical protein
MRDIGAACLTLPFLIHSHLEAECFEFNDRLRDLSSYVQGAHALKLRYLH